MAEVEAVTRNTPAFWRFITGAAYFAPRNTPFTLTAMIRSNVASSTSSTGVGHWGTPALAKKTSRRPQAPHPHLPPLVREQEGRGPADPRSRPRDERDPAVELHREPPLTFRNHS